MQTPSSARDITRSKHQSSLLTFEAALFSSCLFADPNLNVGFGACALDAADVAGGGGVGTVGAFFANGEAAVVAAGFDLSPAPSLFASPKANGACGLACGVACASFGTAFEAAVVATAFALPSFFPGPSLLSCALVPVADAGGLNENGFFFAASPAPLPGAVVAAASPRGFAAMGVECSGPALPLDGNSTEPRATSPPVAPAPLPAAAAFLAGFPAVVAAVVAGAALAGLVLVADLACRLNFGTAEDGASGFFAATPADAGVRPGVVDERNAWAAPATAVAGAGRAAAVADEDEEEAVVAVVLARLGASSPGDVGFGARGRESERERSGGREREVERERERAHRFRVEELGIST